MIPYDDLVAALTAWRAKQGLPITQPVAAASAPARGQAAPPPPTRPAASPHTAGHTIGARPAVALDASDFEDGALVEDASYDAGDDYVMQLGAEPSGEATEIGSVPEPPATAPRRSKRPGGW